LNPKRDWVERAKKSAAVEAVKHVEDGFTVGLGSGSTAAYAIEELGNRIRKERLRVLGVPTSYQAFMLAIKHGVPTTTLEEHPSLDLAIDGADQVDSRLNLIKGMGGALAREKIVASASKRFIIIADESKKAEFLGENDQAVPVEVLPFAAAFVTSKIKQLDGAGIMREGKGKVGPIVTDNGNVILDAHFGIIRNPAELERRLKAFPGIVETGLFISMADVVYLGTRSNVEKLESKH
jgi:ribose 5-phosphate isomerase A